MKDYPYCLSVRDLVEDIKSDGLTEIEWEPQKDGSLLLRMNRLGYRGLYLFRKHELEDAKNSDDLLKYGLVKLYNMSKRGETNYES